MPIGLGITIQTSLIFQIMFPFQQTPRQRMMELLIGMRLSARQLAEHIGISERQVEGHLDHIVKSLARDRQKQFVLEPSECQDCGFVFRDRRRLTQPSRCPRCRSEATTPPRYGIEMSEER